jgi:hypothetical protein
VLWVAVSLWVRLAGTRTWPNIKVERAIGRGAL